ncbi:hypothetical protein FA13DRAFT_1784901 [Coprinellus micaceus]|uniref:Uncharacterized protein n=1 Tax=Coprinellus micaceus TaxID=71717 RepID=A0A4Y7TX56_COPMI|nr:hypothetical protein FA13DRAFT_1784901 [Coprinellus micaceus]
MPQVPPPEIQTPSLRIMLSHFLNQILSHHSRTPSQNPVALHWDSRTKSLKEFAWPCDSSTGDRVLPGELEGHRRSHTFRGPSCLCAFLDGGEYAETQFGIVEGIRGAGLARNGSVLNGEYVAVCARNRCGYFQQFYPLQGIKVQFYKRRGFPLPPQNLIKISDIEKYHSNGAGLFQVLPDMMLRGNAKELESLDSGEVLANHGAELLTDFTEGMSEIRFWSTFVQCLRCKAIFLRQYYAVSHRGTCPRSRATVTSEPYRNGRLHRKARDKTVLRALLGHAPADVPEAYPMASLSIRLRQPSPTPTLGADMDNDMGEQEDMVQRADNEGSD